MVKQNTPEWLEMRKNKIGASDAPIIMGDSPWKTPYQLWEEKLGLAEGPKMNQAMARGHELEPIARQAYNDYTGNCAQEEVVFHPDKPWMMASLDGISLDRSIVLEIKCPGQKDHDIAAAGKVPEKYWAQLQHQLAVIGIIQLHYFSFRDGDFHLVEVERDEAYINKLYAKEGEFWKKMQDFEAPSLSDKDYLERDDDIWLRGSREWKALQEKMNALKEQEKACRQNLIQLAGERNCKGGGVRVQRIVRKGTVDYKAIPELESVDLDKYRKAPVEAWRLS